MNRITCILMLLALPGLAIAQAYDPAIAYLQAGGNSVSLYVANADGSHAVRLATGKSFGGID